MYVVVAIPLHKGTMPEPHAVYGPFATEARAEQIRARLRDVNATVYLDDEEFAVTVVKVTRGRDMGW